MDYYFGTYQRFDTVSKKEAGTLIGADNLVGDPYEMVHELEGGVHRTWLVNRFDQRTGFFDPQFSRKLSVFEARGFTMRAFLSFVAFTDANDSNEDGAYWGEMAVICYDPAYESTFGPFAEAVSARMQEGERPRLDLGEEDVKRIEAADGAWVPKRSVPLPQKEKGTVIMKSRRSASEKMIERGRARNKGCYVVSWAFIVVCVVAVVLIVLRLCGVI